VFVLLFPGVLPAEDEDLDTQMMRATVKIGHAKSTAAGFILCRPDPADGEGRQFILVTAAHFFEESRENEIMVYFRKKEAEGVYKKLLTKLVIRTDGKPRWTKHASEDTAVMTIKPPQDVDLSNVPVDLLATDESLKKYRIRPGDTVSCLGYPHAVEANEGGFPILRSGPIASYPLLPTRTNKTFLVSADVFEGNSGGPVYFTKPNRPVAGQKRQEVRMVLGLVSAQHFLDEEAKMVYGTTKLRHRLGLGIVVHASFIRETIERLP
jgi:hypothetical protein